MCGRFTLRTPAAEIARVFELAGPVPSLFPQDNICPTQSVAVVRCLPAGNGHAVGPEDGPGPRELAFLRWGLIPSWAKDPSVSRHTINARAETVATKPAFRSAFKRRRCLVVADGFYEWQKIGEKRKQPWHIRLVDKRPFGFAGLWERWQGPDGPVESCTIITTDANSLMANIHDRMPVILSPDDYAVWLDPGVEDQKQLKALLTPYPAEAMHAIPTDPPGSPPRSGTLFQ